MVNDEARFSPKVSINKFKGYKIVFKTYLSEIKEFFKTNDEVILAILLVLALTAVRLIIDDNRTPPLPLDTKGFPYIPQEPCWAFYYMGQAYSRGLLQIFSLGVPLICFIILFNVLEIRIKDFKLHKKKYLLFALISIIYGYLFLKVPFDNYYLGDSGHLLRVITIQSEEFPYFITYDEPLELLIHGIAYNILGSAYLAYSYLSIVAGILFVFFSCIFCDLLFNDRVSKIAAFLMLTTIGSMQLFFGYVENYSYLTLGTLLYLLSGYLYLKNKVRILVPSAILVTTIFFHLAAGFFLPSLPILAFLNPGERKPKIIAVFSRITEMTVTCIACAFIHIVIIIQGLTNVTIDAINNTHASDAYFLPLHILFSAPHLLDVVNELILVAPAAILGLVICIVYFKRINYRRAELYFFAVSTIGWLVFIFTWLFGLGAFRDWDLMSPIAIPLTLFVMTTLKDISEDPREYTRIMIPLIAIQAISTILWIYTNSNML